MGGREGVAVKPPVVPPLPPTHNPSHPPTSHPRMGLAATPHHNPLSYPLAAQLPPDTELFSPSCKSCLILPAFSSLSSYFTFLTRRFSSLLKVEAFIIITSYIAFCRHTLIEQTEGLVRSEQAVSKCCVHCNDTTMCLLFKKLYQSEFETLIFKTLLEVYRLTFTDGKYYMNFCDSVIYITNRSLSLWL